MADGQAPETVTTKVDHGYTDMKPGTSGLRKKTRVFMQDDNMYLKVFVQAMFTALTDLGDSLSLEDQVLVVSGDGRYFSTEAISIIASIAHANGVKKLWVGANGLMSTPCVSHIIRERNGGVANGGIILTASHNPGGIDEDFGVKYNDANGGPASSVITDAIFQATLAEGGIELKESTWGEGNTIDLTTPGEYLGGFVEVFDAVSEYVAAMEPIFDLDAIAAFLQRPDFTMIYDAMNGVAGPFAEAVFRGRLGAGEDSVILRRCDPLPDFGGHHPDPNLVYCRDLAVDFGVVPRSDDDPAPMDPPPQFGAAADGDADRNMIVGAGRFVTPSDSVAIIAHYAKDAIPFFKDGLKAVARSMPTSRALDYVATALDVPLFEVPTGWKYFGNLMNSGPSGGTDYNPLICGEESFGTGSNHVREKDGLWAVLCWLAILAHRNPDPAAPLVTVDTIVTEFWAQYGRSYYCRYDYENVETEAAMAVIARLNEFIDADAMPVLGGRQVVLCDNFEYTDPVDALVTANQGIRFGFEDGSRFVVRLSGTGVVGKTIRLYLEQYVGPDGDVMLETADALAPLIAIAMDASQIPELTGRDGPTVIT